VWTKAYLKQQLLVALAGRAGEELVYGMDGLSSLNQVGAGTVRGQSRGDLGAVQGRSGGSPGVV
jgi:hypothetical protein